MTNLATYGLIAGGVLAALLATWRQVKKFNTYRVRKQITVLETKRDEIESKLNSIIPGDDFDANIWRRLHEKRENLNRDIYELRRSVPAE